MCEGFLACRLYVVDVRSLDVIRFLFAGVVVLNSDRQGLEEETKGVEVLEGPAMHVGYADDHVRLLPVLFETRGNASDGQLLERHALGLSVLERFLQVALVE